MPTQARRITVFKDDVARVDMSLDHESDVTVETLFREGNRWATIEVSPTVLPPVAFVGGLLQLGSLGITADEARAFKDRLMATPPRRPSDAYVVAVRLADLLVAGQEFLDRVQGNRGVRG